MSVTAAKGFQAAGIAAGIKANGNPDLALVVNSGPRRAAAGVFTSNRVKAAPVLWSEQVLKGGAVTAVVLNSGGANACTGPQGFQDTHATAERVAEVLGHSAGEVAVASTGLIGLLLPMDKLLPGIGLAAAELSEHGGEKAAIAIKTTDTVHKTAVAGGARGGTSHAGGSGGGTSHAGGSGGGTSHAGGSGGWTVGGMAKGAGMLAPGLATMLVVLTTDADVDTPTLDKALRDATRVTFDRADSDGCMSTNDTVLLLASGASGVTPGYDDFADAVRAVCADLARQLIGDAEGASKDIRIEVVNAATEDEAVDVGRTISRSNLLKCAIHGEDPNWGRVLSAIGTTSAAFEPDRLSVAINGVWVCRNGSVGEDRDLVDMRFREVVITADLAAGDASAVIWTNDLTADYVHENSAYSS
ncbi:bifunctional ornithine acetyltransferase/N-acetylglutamate synthase [Streptomyces sp. NBC_00433]